MGPMYRAHAGRVQFRGHPLSTARARRLLALHRQSAERAKAEGLHGLTAAANALADELQRAIAEASGCSPPGGAVRPKALTEGD